MSPYAVITTGFAAILGAMVAVELLGRAGRAPFRPVGEVVSAALVSRAGRLLVMGAWLWLGVHLLAR